METQVNEQAVPEVVKQAVFIGIKYERQEDGSYKKTDNWPNGKKLATIQIPGAGMPDATKNIEDAISVIEGAINSKKVRNELYLIVPAQEEPEEVKEQKKAARKARKEADAVLLGSPLTTEPGTEKPGRKVKGKKAAKVAAAKAASPRGKGGPIDAAKAAEMYAGGISITDIAVSFGYARGQGQNRTRQALRSLGVYKPKNSERSKIQENTSE